MCKDGPDLLQDFSSGEVSFYPSNQIHRYIFCDWSFIMAGTGRWTTSPQRSKLIGKCPAHAHTIQSKEKTTQSEQNNLLKQT